MNTTQLTVNPENLVKNLRFSFTQATTVLGELMQNARRAGATTVSFDYDEATRQLTVQDNGCGIGCLKTLLAVAESGWDADIIAEEHPFGLGFLSALFACEAIRVISKGGQFTANTAALLAFEAVGIHPVADWHGLTTITLQGFKPEAQQISQQLGLLAEGFPIEVLFNASPLPRPRAIDTGLQFETTGLGQVHLQGFSARENWQQACRHFHVYLQGLPVYHSNNSRYMGHIVHLDPHQFHARLPDRDKLIDEDEVVVKIRQVLQRGIRQKLGQLKQHSPVSVFVDGYEALKAHDCLDLLNDVPVLPKQVLATVQDYPIKDSFGDANLVTIDQWASQADVATGKVNIAKLDDFDSAGAARWLFAWKQGLLIIQADLDANHWLHSYLHDLDKQAVNIDIVNESHRAYFDGQWVDGQTVFCEHYRLTIGDESIVIDDASLFDEDRCLFIVPKGDTSGTVLRQASNYQDEWDNYIESAKEADEWAFHNFVVANTSADPAQALQRLLPSFGNCPALFGRRFELVLDECGQVGVVTERPN